MPIYEIIQGYRGFSIPPLRHLRGGIGAGEVAETTSFDRLRTNGFKNEMLKRVQHDGKDEIAADIRG